uniref:Uncharacterized protein n=1 Tax=Rhinopithecus roxellana TaxID=61622 RepID=A0A2K6QPK0_RHIRO
MSSWNKLLTLYLRPAREYQQLFLQKILWQPGRNGKKKLFSLQTGNAWEP